MKKPAKKAAKKPARRTVKRLPKYEPPAAMSKSLSAAMECEWYFAHNYMAVLGQDAPLSELATTGAEFHAYRSAYVDHLVGTDKPKDPAWVAEYLKMDLSDDVSDLIRRDRFSIDPQAVVGIELYLGVNDAWEPVVKIDNADPGNQELRNRADMYAAGFLDLLTLSQDASTLLIDDCKSGWSTMTVSDYEPAHYAALVFAHFPQVNRVIFNWSFARVKASSESVEYTRADFPDLQALVAERQALKSSIRDAWFQTGTEDLTYNAFSGLCPGCNLKCPGKDLAPFVEIQPLQTDDDAKQAASALALAEEVASGLRKALTPYLHEHGGRLPLAGKWVAEIVQSTRTSYPLPAVVTQVLGVPDIPATNDFSLPAGSLVVGATDLNRLAGAKFRQDLGLPDALAKIAETKPTSRLTIHRVEQKQIEAKK